MQADKEATDEENVSFIVVVAKEELPSHSLAVRYLLPRSRNNAMVQCHMEIYNNGKALYDVLQRSLFKRSSRK